MYNNQPKRTIDFNTDPILNDIDNIVKDGLTKLLGQYLNRYELLERTLQALMNLPSVVDELANRTVSYNFPPIIQEKQNEIIEKDLQAMISANENLLARVDILSKENEELTNELRELKKQLFKDSIDLTVDEVHVKVETLVPVTIDSVEKENIRLEIEENDVPEDEEDEDTDKEEDTDEEEDVEEIPAGTKLGGKTWDGDDWETDDEYEVVEEDDEVVEENDEEEDVQENEEDVQENEEVVDEPELQEDSVEEDVQDAEQEEDDEQEDDIQEAEQEAEQEEDDESDLPME